MTMEEDFTISLDGKNLANLRVVDLKQELEKRGLSKSGSKKDLIKRLKQQLEFEKLCEERKSTGDCELKKELDAATEQNEFVQRYLAQQQKIFAEQKEVKRLVELEESQKKSDTEECTISPKIDENPPSGDDDTERDADSSESSDGESALKNAIEEISLKKKRIEKEVVKDESSEKLPSGNKIVERLKIERDKVYTIISNKNQNVCADIKTGDDKNSSKDITKKVSSEKECSVTEIRNESDTLSVIKNKQTNDKNTGKVIKSHLETKDFEKAPLVDKRGQKDVSFYRDDKNKVSISSSKIESPSKVSDSNIEDKNKKDLLKTDKDSSVVIVEHTDESSRIIGESDKSVLKSEDPRPTTLKNEDKDKDALKIKEENKSALIIKDTNKSALITEDTNKSALITEGTNKSALIIEDTNKSALIIEDTNKSALTIEDTSQRALKIEDTNKSSLIIGNANESVLKSEDSRPTVLKNEDADKTASKTKDVDKGIPFETQKSNENTITDKNTKSSLKTEDVDKSSLKTEDTSLSSLKLAVTDKHDSLIRKEVDECTSKDKNTGDLTKKNEDSGTLKKENKDKNSLKDVGVDESTLKNEKVNKSDLRKEDTIEEVPLNNEESNKSISLKNRNPDKIADLNIQNTTPSTLKIKEENHQNQAASDRQSSIETVRQKSDLCKISTEKESEDDSNILNQPQCKTEEQVAIEKIEIETNSVTLLTDIGISCTEKSAVSEIIDSKNNPPTSSSSEQNVQPSPSFHQKVEPVPDRNIDTVHLSTESFETNVPDTSSDSKFVSMESAVPYSLSDIQLPDSPSNLVKPAIKAISKKETLPPKNDSDKDSYSDNDVHKNGLNSGSKSHSKARSVTDDSSNKRKTKEPIRPSHQNSELKSSNEPDIVAKSASPEKNIDLKSEQMSNSEEKKPSKSMDKKSRRSVDKYSDSDTSPQKHNESKSELDSNSKGKKTSKTTGKKDYQSVDKYSVTDQSHQKNKKSKSLLVSKPESRKPSKAVEKKSYQSVDKYSDSSSSDESSGSHDSRKRKKPKSQFSAKQSKARKNRSRSSSSSSRSSQSKERIDETLTKDPKSMQKKSFEPDASRTGKQFHKESSDKKTQKVKSPSSSSSRSSKSPETSPIEPSKSRSSSNNRSSKSKERILETLSKDHKSVQRKSLEPDAPRTGKQFHKEGSDQKTKKNESRSSSSSRSSRSRETSPIEPSRSLSSSSRSSRSKERISESSSKDHKSVQRKSLESGVSKTGKQFLKESSEQKTQKIESRSSSSSRSSKSRETSPIGPSKSRSSSNSRSSRSKERISEPSSKDPKSVQKKLLEPDKSKTDKQSLKESSDKKTAKVESRASSSSPSSKSRETSPVKPSRSRSSSRSPPPHQTLEVFLSQNKKKRCMQLSKENTPDKLSKSEASGTVSKQSEESKEKSSKAVEQKPDLLQDPPRKKLKINRNNIVIPSLESSEKLTVDEPRKLFSTSSNEKKTEVSPSSPKEEKKMKEPTSPIQSETVEREMGEIIENSPEVKYEPRKINFPGRKLSRKSSEDVSASEPKSKKSKWGKFASSQKSSQTINISSDSLKNWFPEFKLVNEPSVVNDTLFEESPPIKEEKNMSFPLKTEEELISVKQSSSQASHQNTEEPALEATDFSGPVSKIIFVQNLVRPFTLLQLKELLRKNGNFIEEDFWIDKIKSKCFVTYATEEEAIKTRNALNGIRWPLSNPKILSAEFSTEEEFEHHRSGKDTQKPVPERLPEVHETYEEKSPPPANDQRRKDRDSDKRKDRERYRPQAPVREWDKDKVLQDSPDREKADKNVEGFKGPDRKDKKDTKKKATEDTPAKLLDDLFQKTKSAPCIYWLPLTEVQVLEHEESKRLRRLEREKMNQQREKEESELRNKRSRPDHKTRKMDSRRSSTRSRSPTSRRR